MNGELEIVGRLLRLDCTSEAAAMAQVYGDCLPMWIDGHEMRQLGFRPFRDRLGVRWTLRFAKCKNTNFQEGEGYDAKIGVSVTPRGSDW
jgi:hypothetical protein